MAQPKPRSRRSHPEVVRVRGATEEVWESARREGRERGGGGRGRRWARHLCAGAVARLVLRGEDVAPGLREQVLRPAQRVQRAVLRRRRHDAGADPEHDEERGRVDHGSLAKRITRQRLRQPRCACRVSRGVHSICTEDSCTVAIAAAAIVPEELISFEGERRNIPSQPQARLLQQRQGGEATTPHHPAYPQL